MSFKTTRDWLQQTIYKIIAPAVHGMIKIGITPNVVTTTGLVLNIVAAGILVYGGFYSEPSDYSYMGWGGALILFAGLFDMMDGQVARIGNMKSTFGALFDSVLDRYSELITFFGLCSYLTLRQYFFAAIVAFIALVGSLMVSYVRARAEGLDIECKVGLMQRPERVVLTSLGALCCGLYAHFVPDPSFDPIWVLTVPLLFVAIFSNITAFGRLRHCYKVMKAMENKD